MSSGKCKFKEQTTVFLEWPKSGVTTPNSGNHVEQQELSLIADKTIQPLCKAL